MGLFCSDPPNPLAKWEMTSMKYFIVSQCLFYAGFKRRENGSWINKFDLEFTRMDVDINHVTWHIDIDDSKRIFAMSYLSMITIHYCLLQSSVLDWSAVYINLAILVRTEGERGVADYSIDDNIRLIVIDAVQLLRSIFFEQLDDSGLNIVGNRKIMDKISILFDSSVNIMSDQSKVDTHLITVKVLCLT